MRVTRWVVAGAIALSAAGATSGPAMAQETAFKVGVSFSRFAASDATFWDERLTSTFFGGGIRFPFGRIALQPELYVVTRGASASAAAEEEQMRVEYIDLPVLLVVPLQVGRLEPFVYGGPSISLESRCRYVIRQQGLRTNFGCDPPPNANVFDRTAFDFGVVGGGGLGYRIGAGRVLVEARHNWGLRNINQTAGLPDIRNRTFSLMLGYSLSFAGN